MKTNILIWLLRAARHRIEQRQSRFICCAINREISYNALTLKVSYQEVCEHAQYLTRWISKMLRGNHTLEAWWLERSIGRDLSHLKLTTAARETRLAWIDWMIRHLEENPL